jgi:ArsR family transcriptional regulator
LAVVNVLEKSPAQSASPGRTSDSEENDSPVGLSPEMLADGLARDLVRVFKVLSDATRLRILYFLLQADELHVRALCDLLRQSQPAVSHHLALLRVAGLIDSRRQGKHNFYRLLPAGFHQLLDQVYATVPSGLRRTRFEQHVLRAAFPDGDTPSPQR